MREVFCNHCIKSYEKESFRMKQKLLKVVAMSVVIMSLSSSYANASELYAMPSGNAVEHESKDLEAVEAEVFTESEMLEMCSIVNPEVAARATAVQPDKYEPNDTMETAYPYAKTEKLTGTPFIEGYTASNAHVEGDQDFFSITLSPLYTYDVVLKNLYGQDRHIYIWESNGDGTWTRWRYKYQQTAEPEYWRFTPEAGGTYYIQIAGGGIESFSYFFAVERTGKINTDLWPTANNT